MLKILYRACNNELYGPFASHRPKWFDKIKCFNSIHNSISASKFKNDIEMIVFIDGDKSVLSDHIKNLGYQVIYNNFLSNSKSFKNSLDFAENEITDSDIYFLEDDYLHVINTMDHLYPAISHFGLATPYNMYAWPGYNSTAKISESIEFNGIEWERIVGTTCTWAVSKEKKKIMLDHNKKYQSDTKISDCQMFRDLYKNPDIEIFQPSIGLATHLYIQHMSIGVNWETVNNNS